MSLAKVVVAQHRRVQGSAPTGAVELVLFAVALTHAAVSAPTPALADEPVRDLAQLLTTAEQTSQDLEAAEQRIRAAEAQLSEARFSPFFQFELEAGVAWVPDATGVAGYTLDPPNQLRRDFGPAVQGRIRGAVPLWTFGKLEAARDAAGAGVKAARADRQRVRNQLWLNTRRAYYGLQLALDLQQMISEGLPRLQKAQARLEERLEEGDDEDIDAVDGYRLSTAAAEIQARASEATRLERSTRYALQILTGREHIRIPECPIQPVQLQVKPLQSYVAQSLGSRPEVRQLQAAKVARAAQLMEKRARFLPDLAIGLEAEGRYIPGQTAFEHYRPYFAGAGLVARWSLDFWGHATRAERAEAEAEALAAQSQLAMRGIELEVQTKYEALQDAQRRMTAWEEGHQSARSWFVSAAQGFGIGTVTAKELIDGLSAYFKARLAHLQAIHDHNAALAALEWSVGEPLLAMDAWEERCDLPLVGESSE